MKPNLKSCFLILLFCQGLFYLVQTDKAADDAVDLTNLVCVTWKNGGCQACQSGYLVTMETCIVCPDGKTSMQGAESSYDCYACTAGDGCKHCIQPNVDQCVTCKNGYYLENGKCVACAQGLFSPEGSTSVAACKTCTTGCSVCEDPTNKDSCTSCAETYYLPSGSNKGQCSSCGEGLYSPKGSVGSGSCKACTNSGCKICPEGAGKCSVCKANFYLQSNDCVACPTGKKSPEGSSGSASCIECSDDGCEQCGTANQCATCKAGYYLKDNKCIPCGAGKSSYKGSTSVDACVLCDGSSDCLTCSSPDPNSCTSCAAGNYVVPQGYCEGCGGSKYYDKCTKCTADGKCASCEYPYFVTASKECDRCAGTNYPTSKTTKKSECKKCEDDNCWTCTGAGTGKCTECRLDAIIEKGKCKNCPPGQYLKGTGPFTWDDCTVCSDGCYECNSWDPTMCYSCYNGTYFDEEKYRCHQCDTGYSAPLGATSASECFKCSDKNCEHCSGKGTGKCISCAENFYLKDNKCVACPDGGFSPPGSTSKDVCGVCYDENCDYCTNWSIYGCQECKIGYYKTGSKCNLCGEGKSSPIGATSVSQCFDCEDSNCVSCVAKGKGECSACEDDYYLADDSTCKVCEVENCKGCKSNGQCASCESGYYMAEDNTCKTCEDENCKACDGANIGRCTSCESGFKLVRGTCKASGEEAPKTNNLVSATIRYDMTMAKFNEEGGKNYFIAKTSRALRVDIEQVTVSSVRKGSVIVDYEVALSGDATAAKNMKKAMDAAVPGGHMDFYTGGKVLNYDSQVGARDTGDDGGSSNKIGIIIGVVAGVVCVIVAFVIWKKLSIMKAKKMGSMNVKNKNKVIAIDDSADKTFKIEQVSA